MPGSDVASWRAASELYFEDKVIGAWEVLEPNSGMFGGAMLGQYRLFEGEARTRQASQMKPLAPWLDFEWIPGDLPHAESVGQVVLDAAAHVGQRLQWDRHEKVLATILIAEADADWHEARYGYFVDKTPYDKICLPLAACIHPAGVWQVAAHEFTHVIVLNTTQNAAPHWLDEGFACLMEGRDPFAARERLRVSNVWRDPHDAELAFGVDRRESSNMHGVRSAYDQSLVLVSYLFSLKGDAGLVSLLKAFTNHSEWVDMLAGLTNHDPADRAIKATFGFGIKELFERAEQHRFTPTLR
jgi:hypothetical protein